MKRARQYLCNKSSDSFCYACGLFAPISTRRYINEQHKDLYLKYFGIEIKNQDTCWVPHTICSSCRNGLTMWSKNQGHMNFGTPMIWRDPVNHQTNCYICLTDIFGFSSKTKQNIAYAAVSSVTLPVAHSPELPIPPSPVFATPGYAEDEDDSSEDQAEGGDPLYIPDTEQPHPLTQMDLNDLVRDLNLSKSSSELLASRLQQWSLLERGVKVTAFRERSLRLSECFAQQDRICYCKDISQLFTVMHQPFDPDEWRLFIDGGKNSIKAVLLHNGNLKPSVPVAFAIGLKEEYPTMKNILQLIQYDRFKFLIVADLKVVAILMGLQSGYTKFCCFLCLWDSRAYSEHYTRATWPMRTELVPGTANVKFDPLVTEDRIIIPPLHIKLGLMSIFVRALGKDHPALDYLHLMFPKLSKMKIKSGVFVGPQIRKVIFSDDFKDYLTRDQKAAWISFEAVIEGFLGNYRSPNYRELIANLLENYRKIGAHLSLKMHFLKSHLDFFPEDLGAFSDEHGERFHQDISDIEDRFNGRYTPQMLGEYCWTLLRDTRAMHKRNGPKRHF